jgi:hypothetical protein
MRNVIEYRREIGPAAWLLFLYWQQSAPTEDPSWCVVANGDPVHDRAIAKHFSISTRTAAHWRRRLEDSGLSVTEGCSSGAFRIWLLRFDQPDVAPKQAMAPVESWPGMPTQMVQ